ncbi:hypothetical protein [Turneriella parva]|uniref:Uncharacterized protein n=1 Tax=Turneriella parva (strain ATCC BAA-1111 / DSM 21527 / NCTC 11395 / H) TaxID=869212 RepID=I4B5F9_TURPD|nr:hypothetical protein [Turneriella parva]AFM12516.1 hypothetical protein Turpa_1869 [Turneriella parva DSM 21527]
MKAPRALVAVAIAALFLAMTRSSFAHEFANCHNTLDQSCWSVTNNSSAPITLICQHEGIGSEFKAIAVEPGRSWSFQYCPGLADGMGFSGGKVACRLEQNRGSAVWRFETREFGERVAFSVPDQEAVATVSSYWNKGKVKKHSFSLSGTK